MSASLTPRILILPWFPPRRGEARSESLAPAGEEGEARVRGGAVAGFAGPDRAEAKLARVRPPPVPAGRNVDLPAGGREAGTERPVEDLAVLGAARGNGQCRLPGLDPERLRDGKA